MMQEAAKKKRKKEREAGVDKEGEVREGASGGTLHDRKWMEYRSSQAVSQDWSWDHQGALRPRREL